MKPYSLRDLTRTLRKGRALIYAARELDVPTRRILEPSPQAPHVRAQAAPALIEARAPVRALEPSPEAPAAPETWASGSDDLLSEIIERGKTDPQRWAHISYDDAENTMRRVRVVPGSLEGRDMPPGVTESNLTIPRARLHLVPLEVEVLEVTKEKKEIKEKEVPHDEFVDMSADELRALLRAGKK